MMGKGGPMMGPMGMNPQMQQMQQMQQIQMMQMMQQKGQMGKGGPMPQQAMGKGGPQPGPSPAPQQQPPQGQALNAAALAAAPPAVQKQMIGEKLYPAIAKFRPAEAGKITGMMLEMDNSELLMLLESDAQLIVKVDEAMNVLRR